MYHNVCAVLNGTDEIRSSEGVVNNEGQAVLMGKLCESVNIWNVAVGVTEGFDVNRSGVILNSRLNFGKVVNVYKRGGNAEVRERV